MMYGFMGIWAIEIGEMASRKNWLQKQLSDTSHAQTLKKSFFWGHFFQDAISPISMAHIPMKPYIIRKEIEWTQIWLLF